MSNIHAVGSVVTGSSLTFSLVFGVEFVSVLFSTVWHGMACQITVPYTCTHARTSRAPSPFWRRKYCIVSYRIVVSCRPRASLVTQCPTLKSMDGIALHCTRCACVQGSVALQKRNLGRSLDIDIAIAIVSRDTRRRHPAKRRLRRRRLTILQFYNAHDATGSCTITRRRR